MAVFPYVLYDADKSALPIKANQNLIDIYIKAWGLTNDENFDQSAPGKLINSQKAA